MRGDPVHQNGARARPLVDLAPIKGVENAHALDALVTEMEDCGLGEHVEVRAFPGPTYHRYWLGFRCAAAPGE
jgi:hypothetical protein